MIGPKQLLLIPLKQYQNHEDQNVQCLDDFELKIQQKEEFSTTHIIQTQYSHKKVEKIDKKVKFNPTIISYKFHESEPAITISKQMKKLIQMQPNQKWINPNIQV
ncbi:unnamed protein product [Paramecium primaurelia]|uniref:Uncharacterized protein n=1 Tax=Paramecium primaurelia TaxID=5886 RepID=A0A8S1P529_PARPR|nr:unnamed protein product [Paramecium primaurelia]